MYDSSLLPPQARHVPPFPRFHVVTTPRNVRTRTARCAIFSARSSSSTAFPVPARIARFRCATYFFAFPPLLQRYRNAWFAFVQSLAGLPVPRLERLFESKQKLRPAVKQEVRPAGIRHLENARPVALAEARAFPRFQDRGKNRGYFCNGESDFYGEDLARSPSNLAGSKQSTPSRSAELTAKPSALGGGASGTGSQNGGTGAEGGAPTVLAAKSGLNEALKGSNASLSVQYIACCKCGKRRAVPGCAFPRGLTGRTLDVSLLPHFECSMNIWDDNKYNACNIEENVDVNYVINLSVDPRGDSHV